MKALRSSPPAAANGAITISVGKLHEGQRAAFSALLPHRFKALRCGRRFGKTELAKSWIKQGLVQGEPCAWFTPQHMQSLEVFHELTNDLGALVESGSRADGVLRLLTGGRIDFWTLENPSAGRSRGLSDNRSIARGTSRIPARCVDVREKIAISLLCMALGGCATVHDYVYGPPAHFIVFFNGKGTALSSDGLAIVKSAAARIAASHPTSIVIESGVDAGGDLAEPRFTAVRQALIDDGVAQDLIARSAIPGPKLAGNNNITGDQRVEIRLLAKAP